MIGTKLKDFHVRQQEVRAFKYYKIGSWSGSRHNIQPK